jgi:hypothetical protein
MTLEIPENLLKYVTLTQTGDRIERFKCPVCSFTTKLGPGALRMHLLLKADQKNETRYDKAHESYYKEYQREIGLDSVRILASMPRSDIGLS